MTGHEALVAMRKRGFTPRVVFIDTEPDALEMWRHWPDENRSHACISVGREESLIGLDLRCVVGLVVIVSGENAARGKAVGALCEQAQASRVVVNVTRTVWRNDCPHSEVLHCTDTAGVIA